MLIDIAYYVCVGTVSFLLSNLIVIGMKEIICRGCKDSDAIVQPHETIPGVSKRKKIDFDF